ncbi:MAG: hypothetical protein E7547_02755 [Ruminococcaceae bacterium]|nr:hypothetical protein [Oscillospiraceae bacterium]
MGEPVLVYGKSGSGKSRSLKNFAEDEIFLINVVSKRLPFQKQFKYILKSRNYATIKSQLSKMSCKVAVIDDAGYLQTNTFMNGHSAPKKGSNTFDLFNQIGDEFWDLVLFVKEQLPEDVIVYFTMHEISNDIGEVKVRTIGKLLDEKVCIEGMFTICLHCMTDGTKHFFKTQGGTNDIAKSPEDMFELEIENDLKAVDNRIREFWNF